jgi:hypothetical protein
MEFIQPPLMFLFIALLPCVVQSQSLTDAKTLQTDLFTGYKKGVRPVLNQSVPLNIGINFVLSSFNSFSEVDETLSLTAGLGLNWTDASLNWNPSSYGNLYTTIIDPVEIWTPPIFLVNRVDALESIGSDTKFYTTLVYSGQVIYAPGGIMNAKCPTDISKFPFDTQTCALFIVPWGITMEHLTFTPLSDKAQLGFFTPHSDWTLQGYSTTVINMNGYSTFKVDFTMKRHPLYFSVMILLPTLLFSLLNPLVFLLPVESGERVSLSMTILLSYAIFLTLVSNSIPKTSNPMCTLLIVMIVIISLSGVIVIGAIITAKYFHQDSDVKTGVLMNYIASRILKKRGNKVMPLEDKEETLTGKDFSCVLDYLFLRGTYLVIALTILGYFLYVAI